MSTYGAWDCMDTVPLVPMLRTVRVGRETTVRPYGPNRLTVYGTVDNSTELDNLLTACNKFNVNKGTLMQLSAPLGSCSKFGDLTSL
jgi:hypothetical protein